MQAGAASRRCAPAGSGRFSFDDAAGRERYPASPGTSALACPRGFPAGSAACAARHMNPMHDMHHMGH
ncbi:MAG TPA: hypothetical protein PLO07_14205, partial [Rubrivivax sp.]|nr:hypothetical protein [Rubrivivax sp.]